MFHVQAQNRAWRHADQLQALPVFVALPSAGRQGCPKLLSRTRSGRAISPKWPSSGQSKTISAKWPCLSSDLDATLTWRPEGNSEPDKPSF
jgi:hypothetical protein